MLAMAAVVMVKVADVAAAATVTDGGTARAELVFDKVMPAPPIGAALDKVTEHELEELGPMLVGVQVSEETDTAATRLTVVLTELLL